MNGTKEDEVYKFAVALSDWIAVEATARDFSPQEATSALAIATRRMLWAISVALEMPEPEVLEHFFYSVRF